MKAKNVKLTPTQRKALIKSIQHWGEIVEAEGDVWSMISRKSCELCRNWNFSEDSSEDDCDGCPVSAAAGDVECMNTPLETLWSHNKDHLVCELQFLVQLLNGRIETKRDYTKQIYNPYIHPQSKEALRKSIAHWIRLASGTQRVGEGPTADQCALCNIFICQKNCNGCPISQVTNKGGCRGTPYGEAAFLLVSGQHIKEAYLQSWRQVEFLCGLYTGSIMDKNGKLKDEKYWG